jgi:hypothetical protein
MGSMRGGFVRRLSLAPVVWLLFAAVGTLMVLSYVRPGAWPCLHGIERWRVQWFGGRLIVERITIDWAGSPRFPQHRLLTRVDVHLPEVGVNPGLGKDTILWSEQIGASRGVAGTGLLRPVVLRDNSWEDGLGFDRVDKQVADLHPGFIWYDAIAMPIWPAALAALAAWGWSLRIVLRKRACRRRYRRLRCGICDYDLRATPVAGGPLHRRCPECGTAVPVIVAPLRAVRPKPASPPDTPAVKLTRKRRKLAS